MSRQRAVNRGGGATEVVVTAQHDPNVGAELSTSVLMALGEIPGCDIESTDDVVVTQVDLEAVDDLFSPAPEIERAGYISFPVDGYEVTVTASGEITVSECPTASD